MLLTNTTSNYYYVGDASYLLPPAPGTVTIPDNVYNNNDSIAKAVNNLDEINAATVSSTPDGYPRTIETAGGGGGAPSGPAGGDLTGTYPNPSVANEAVTIAKMDSGAATAGQVPTADGAGAVTYETPPGTQLAYEERTTSLTVTASTEAGANIIVAADAVSLDGSTPIRVEFFTPNVTLGSAGANLHIWLFDAVDGGAAASLGRLADVSDDAASNFALMLARLFTPAAGSHVFSARASSTVGTDPVFTPGAGGAGAMVPIYILVAAA